MTEFSIEKFQIKINLLKNCIRHLDPSLGTLPYGKDDQYDVMPESYSDYHILINAYRDVESCCKVLIERQQKPFSLNDRVIELENQIANLNEALDKANEYRSIYYDILYDNELLEPDREVF